MARDTFEFVIQESMTPEDALTRLWSVGQAYTSLERRAISRRDALPKGAELLKVERTQDAVCKYLIYRETWTYRGNLCNDHPASQYVTRRGFKVEEDFAREVLRREEESFARKMNLNLGLPKAVMSIDFAALERSIATTSPAYELLHGKPQPPIGLAPSAAPVKRRLFFLTTFQSNFRGAALQFWREKLTYPSTAEDFPHYLDSLRLHFYHNDKTWDFTGDLEQYCPKDVERMRRICDEIVKTWPSPWPMI